MQHTMILFLYMDGVTRRIQYGVKRRIQEDKGSDPVHIANKTCTFIANKYSKVYLESLLSNKLGIFLLKCQ